MAARTRSFEGSLQRWLQDTETAAHYLDDALQESVATFLRELRRVAEARQVGRGAESPELRREDLYRMLPEEDTSCLESLDVALKALGFRLAIETYGGRDHGATQQAESQEAGGIQ